MSILVQVIPPCVSYTPNGEKNAVSLTIHVCGYPTRVAILRVWLSYMCGYPTCVSIPVCGYPTCVDILHVWISYMNFYPRMYWLYPTCVAYMKYSTKQQVMAIPHAKLPPTCGYI